MTSKRGKWERKHKASAAPPSPEETAALAAAGTDINRGRSDKLPLSREGEAEVTNTAAKLEKKGGLDKTVTSPATRTEQTKAAIDAAAGPLPDRRDPNLESWAQGNLEGQPTALVKDQIKDLVRTNPRNVLPGQGALSSKPGESFDQFRLRALPAVRGVMQELANDPTAKIGMPLHSAVIKLTRGWLENGAPDDFSIKPEAMDGKTEEPGSVVRLFPDKAGRWELKDVNLDDKAPLDAGIYMIRHGMTPWNKENYKPDGRQDAIAQIARHTRALDFRKVQAAAQNSGLSDDEISSAIDGSLPDPDSAADLPNHHLLAITAAASPEKRKTYAPIVQERFGDLSQLPYESRNALASHLGRIGIRQQVASITNGERSIT